MAGDGEEHVVQIRGVDREPGDVDLRLVQSTKQLSDGGDTTVARDLQDELIEIRGGVRQQLGGGAQRLRLVKSKLNMPTRSRTLARKPKTVEPKSRKVSRQGSGTAVRGIGQLPEWNLADLYPGLDSPEIKRDLDRADSYSTAFEEAFKGKLAEIAARPDGGVQLVEAIVIAMRHDVVPNGVPAVPIPRETRHAVRSQ